MNPIKTVLLLGGGEAFWLYLKHLRQLGDAKLIALTSERHLDEHIGDVGTLREALATTDVQWVELAALNAAALDQLAIDLSTTVAISMHAAWIIRQDVIDALSGRVFNVHGTRLPQDRGGAGVSWQILRGNQYGVAVMHRVDVGIDTGDIVDFHEFLYDGCRTPVDYRRRYVDETMKLLERITPRLLSGEELGGLQQIPYLSSYWPRLNTEIHGWIDWSWSGTDILRFVRAFDDPYEGAHTLLGNRVVYLKDADFDTGDGAFHPFQAGLVYRVTGNYAAVCVTTGTLLIGRVFDQEHIQIPLTDLKPGQRLFTPIDKLEEAKRTRVQYNASGLQVPGN